MEFHNKSKRYRRKRDRFRDRQQLDSERSKSLHWYMDILSKMDLPIPREDAVKLFYQIKGIKDGRKRRKLFAKLERLLGVQFSDSKETYEATNMLPDGYIIVNGKIQQMSFT